MIGIIIIIIIIHFLKWIFLDFLMGLTFSFEVFTAVTMGFNSIQSGLILRTIRKNLELFYPEDGGNQIFFSLPIACFLLVWLPLWPWGWREYVPPKRWWTYTSLHDVTSQNIIVLGTLKVRRLGALDRKEAPLEGADRSPLSLHIAFHSHHVHHYPLPYALASAFSSHISQGELLQGVAKSFRPSVQMVHLRKELNRFTWNWLYPGKYTQL
jgi:hypothetical protein